MAVLETQLERRQSSAVTHTGAVREVNEDAVLDFGTCGLWAVADGMGGHEAGHVASTMLVDALQNVNCTEKLSVLVDQVEAVTQKVHQDIRAHAVRHFDGRTMGCTLISLLIRGDLGACVWAGDSRLYCFRDGELNPVSEDHSRVNEMLKEGLITAEEAENHPNSNVITRAVGATQHLFLDTSIFTVQAGDVFLLCSDGLYGDVPKAEIQQILQSSDSERAADNLLQRALEHGARDNVSVIVVAPKSSAMGDATEGRPAVTIADSGV